MHDPPAELSLLPIYSDCFMVIALTLLSCNLANKQSYQYTPPSLTGTRQNRQFERDVC